MTSNSLNHKFQSILKDIGITVFGIGILELLVVLTQKAQFLYSSAIIIWPTLAFAMFATVGIAGGLSCAVILAIDKIFAGKASAKVRPVLKTVLLGILVVAAGFGFYQVFAHNWVSPIGLEELEKGNILYVIFADIFVPAFLLVFSCTAVYTVAGHIEGRSVEPLPLKLSQAVLGCAALGGWYLWAAIPWRGWVLGWSPFALALGLLLFAVAVRLVSLAVSNLQSRDTVVPTDDTLPSTSKPSVEKPKLKTFRLQNLYLGFVGFCLGSVLLAVIEQNVSLFGGFNDIFALPVVILGIVLLIGFAKPKWLQSILDKLQPTREDWAAVFTKDIFVLLALALATLPWFLQFFMNRLGVMPAYISLIVAPLIALSVFQRKQVYNTNHPSWTPMLVGFDLCLLFGVLFAQTLSLPLVMVALAFFCTHQIGDHDRRRIFFASATLVTAVLVVLVVFALKGAHDTGIVVLSAALVMVAVLFYFFPKIALGVALALISIAPSLVSETLGVDRVRSPFGTTLFRADSHKDELGLIRLFGNHGILVQQIIFPEVQKQPLGAYSSFGPVGEILNVVDPVNIAALGLGGGSLACLEAPGRFITFFEANPIYRYYATERFGFLNLCPEHVVNPVSGRYAFASKSSEIFDLIVIDSLARQSVTPSDISVEALRTYLDMLPPNGAIAIQLTHPMVSVLPPLIAAQAVGIRGVVKVFKNIEGYDLVTPSSWAVLTNSDTILVELVERGWQPIGGTVNSGISPWTDSQSSSWSTL